MATTDKSSENVTFNTAQARVRDGNVAAVSAVQQATTGKAGALDVRSENADAAAVEVRGAGDLLVLRDSSGTAKLTVAQSGALTTSGAQTVTGDYTITGDLTVNGGAVFNEASAAENFRVESDGNANMLFVDGTNNRVGVGTGTPATALDVTGVLSVSTGAVINETGADSDTRIEGDTEVNLVFVDASTDRVGVGTATPGQRFSVVGGNVSVATAGNGLMVAEGSNAKMGTAALTAGAATVSTTAVTANSRIFLTSNADGGAPGFVRVSARVAGTSFTITSSSGTDTSTIAWMMVEPAA